MSSRASNHKVTVLLVDDQKMVGEAVRRMLAGEPNINFHYCPDPGRALATAVELGPTVILQDLVMPGVDGLELVRAYRALPQTRDVPLIVLSTKEEPEVKVKAFALGANDYIVKLPDRLELVARIRYHSQGYISAIERDEAYKKLVDSQRQLERHTAFIRDTFGRYLSDEVVTSLLNSPGGLQLGGESRRCTIMMADLRGFTALSERLPAAKVVSLLNNFLEAMTDVIFLHGGTIDEFMGDAILVVFGAPVARDNDTQRAVACAVAMQLAMPTVNARNVSEGLPMVEMGIGLHTGEVVAGNIGSKKRAKYGVVGPAVNLTSRIESYTVGGQILISEETRTECEAGAPLRIDGQLEVEPKGFTRPITIYEVGGIGGAYGLELPLRDSGLVALTDPVPIRFTVLDGKRQDGDVFTGSIVRVSAGEVEVQSETRMRALTDLKLEITAPGAAAGVVFYGKVLARGERPGFCLRFTSLPEEVDGFLRERLAAPGSPA